MNQRSPEESHLTYCEFSFRHRRGAPKTGPRQGAGPCSALISAEGLPMEDQPAEGPGLGLQHLALQATVSILIYI